MSPTQINDDDISDKSELSEEEETDQDFKSMSSSKIPVKLGDDSTLNLSKMYQNWFLDYASYVILERAVPHITDGLKPVQRRILHAMKQMDDGRYNKVANIIGSTMQYHPHGDASIGDALVQLGQKELLIDCQGNWGNIFTGDGAAAPVTSKPVYRNLPLRCSLMRKPPNGNLRMTVETRNRSRYRQSFLFCWPRVQKELRWDSLPKYCPITSMSCVMRLLPIWKEEIFIFFPIFRQEDISM